MFFENIFNFIWAQNQSPRRLPPLIEVPLKTIVHRDYRLGTSTKWGCEIYRALPNAQPPRLCLRWPASRLLHAWGASTFCLFNNLFKEIPVFFFLHLNIAWPVFWANLCKDFFFYLIISVPSLIMISQIIAK